MARLRTRKSRTRKSRTRKSRIRRINKFKKYIERRKNIQKRSNRLKKSYRGTSKHRRFKTIKKRGKYRQSRKKLYGGTGKIGVIVGKEELKASSPLEDDAKLNAKWQGRMVFIKHDDGNWRWAQITELLGFYIGDRWVCETIKCKLNQAGTIKEFVRPPAFSRQNLLIPYDKLYVDRTHIFITHTDEKSNLQVLLKREVGEEIWHEVPWETPASDWIELYCMMIGHKGEYDDEIVAFVAKHPREFIPWNKQFQQVRLSDKVSKLKEIIQKYMDITVNRQTIETETGKRLQVDTTLGENGVTADTKLNVIVDLSIPANPFIYQLPTQPELLWRHEMGIDMDNSNLSFVRFILQEKWRFKQNEITMNTEMKRAGIEWENVNDIRSIIDNRAKTVTELKIKIDIMHIYTNEQLAYENTYEDIQWYSLAGLGGKNFVIKDKGKNISDSFHPAIGDHRTLMKKTDMQKKNGYFDVNYQKWAEADLMAKYEVKTNEDGHGAADGSPRRRGPQAAAKRIQKMYRDFVVRTNLVRGTLKQKIPGLIKDEWVSVECQYNFAEDKFILINSKGKKSELDNPQVDDIKDRPRKMPNRCDIWEGYTSTGSLEDRRRFSLVAKDDDDKSMWKWAMERKRRWHPVEFPIPRRRGVD